ncbi:hypothetical protein J4439_01545 [Candidatus Woesearchaeota archaeon]|nr:hypothetical protein [Candidatus Woesearchaeota archaeon]
MVRWTLDGILPGTPEEALAQLERGLQTLSSWHEGLEDARQRYGEYLSLLDGLEGDVQRVRAYAELLRAEDTSSAHAAQLLEQIDMFESRYAREQRRGERWLQSLDDAGFSGLSAAPEYAAYLSRTRAAAPHTLPEEQEDALGQEEALSILPLVRDRDALEGSQHYAFKPVGGVPQVFDSEAPLLAFSRSPDPAGREAACRAQSDGYRENIGHYHAVFREAAASWQRDLAARGYTSPLEKRADLDQIAEQALHLSLDACLAHREVFQRYFRLKARFLGMERLRSCDMDAPLGTARERSLDDALQDILSMFGDISPAFGERAARVVREGHLDALPREGKYGTPFCAAVPGSIPYVSTLFQGAPEDVLTLAHELGHAVHYLSGAHLPVLVQEAPIPLQETAATFFGTAMASRLLEQAESKSAVRKLLDTALSSLYDFTLRSAASTHFECLAHEALSAGIDADGIADLHLSALEDRLGDSVMLTPEQGHDWAVDSMYYVEDPFYRTAYPFGQLLSLVLWDEYRARGKEFTPYLERLFGAGGSVDARELLLEASIDICAPATWERAFRVISGMVDQLEDAVAEPNPQPPI